MEKSFRKTTRTRREQLLTLVNVWDPAGLIAGGAPRDAYDGIIDKLLSFVSERPPRDELARFLDENIREHFGKAPVDAAQFANKAITWFDIASAEPE